VHIHGTDADRLRDEPEIDLERPGLGNQRFQGALGVAHEVDGDEVAAGWDTLKNVPPAVARGGGSVQPGRATTAPVTGCEVSAS